MGPVDHLQTLKLEEKHSYDDGINEFSAKTERPFQNMDTCMRETIKIAVRSMCTEVVYCY